VYLGVIPEDAWPYKAGEYAVEPPPAAASAPRYKVLASKRLTGLREIKAALQGFGPVIAGVTRYKSAWADEVRRTGRIPVPGPNDSVTDVHGLCIVGFDDKQRLFKFQNTLGTAWGDRGYGYLPYEYVERNLSEFWAIVL
jgi:C1A family cysteine protease